VIQTPFRSPQANAHAERFVRTARTECLDWLLILGRRQLDRILRVYVDHYNTERPHRALGRAHPSRPRHQRHHLRSPLSSDATDSAASCTRTTSPQRDRITFWHPSPNHWHLVAEELIVVLDATG
jgi:transposase InsO family protein